MRFIAVTSWLWIVSNTAHANQKCLDMHVIDSKPVGYVNSDNQLAGSQVEMLEALESASGLCINKTLMSYIQLWKSIERKDHDGGFIFKNEKRLHLVKPIAFSAYIRTLVVPKYGINIKRLEDLYKLSIGRASEMYVGKKVLEDNRIALIDIDNYKYVPELLKSNRIDAIAGSEVIIKHHLEKLNHPKDINIDGSYEVGKQEMWLQLSLREHPPELIDTLSKAVRSLREDKTFEVILSKYKLN